MTKPILLNMLSDMNTIHVYLHVCTCIYQVDSVLYVCICHTRYRIALDQFHEFDTQPGSRDKIVAVVLQIRV